MEQKDTTVKRSNWWELGIVGFITGAGTIILQEKVWPGNFEDISWQVIAGAVMYGLIFGALYVVLRKYVFPRFAKS